MKTIKISSSFWVAASALLIIFTLLLPNVSDAAVQCTFDRNLESGMNGEDVRCLQKYLNDAGFVIAQSGPGSPGNETSLFREATKSALVKWQQANGLTPAIGFFGPLSRAKYSDLINGNSSGEVLGATTSSGETDQLQGLLQQLDQLQNQLDTAKQNENKVQESDVTKKILDAANELKRAEDQVEEALEDGLNIGRADDNIADARDEFYGAVIAFLGNNFERALSLASYALGNALDAFEDAGGKTEADDVEEYIDEVDDMINDARDEVDEADDNGRYVERAEELLDEAEDVLKDAEDKLDDGDVDEARELAEDAEDLVDDALDSISSNDKRDAEEAIDDAADAIDDAWDEVRDADRDGEDVDDAEDLLKDAEDALDDAQDAYDDGDYDEAVEKAEEAEDLARDALDEI